MTRPMNKLLLALLVLAASSGANAALNVSTDGQQVTDTRTGLVWRRCAEGMSWSGATCAGAAWVFDQEAALAFARAQASATGVAWRLPNVKELSSIADKSLLPPFDATAFPATPADYFWSSTPYLRVPAFAWFVDFRFGNVTYDNRVVNRLHVRLVRGGQ